MYIFLLLNYYSGLFTNPSFLLFPVLVLFTLYIYPCPYVYTASRISFDYQLHLLSFVTGRTALHTCLKNRKNSRFFEAFIFDLSDFFNPF